jgi:hypothetical protein
MDFVSGFFSRKKKKNIGDRSQDEESQINWLSTIARNRRFLVCRYQPDEENIVGRVHGSISTQKAVTCLNVPHRTAWQMLDFEVLILWHVC